MAGLDPAIHVERLPRQYADQVRACRFILQLRVATPPRPSPSRGGSGRFTFQLARTAFIAFAVAVLHIFVAGGAAAVGFVGLTQKASGACGFGAFTFEVHCILQESLGAP